MIRAHLGPWRICTECFSFCFAFVEIFSRKVRQFWLRGVLYMTPLSELPLLMLKISLPIINELTHKVILPDCPFKSIQRPATILDSDSALCILSPQCHAHHGGLTPRWARYRGDFFLKKSKFMKYIRQSVLFYFLCQVSGTVQKILLCIFVGRSWLRDLWQPAQCGGGHCTSRA